MCVICLIHVASINSYLYVLEWYGLKHTNGQFVNYSYLFISDLKKTKPGYHVNIGNIVGKDDNKIWTIPANTESTNTPVVLIHGFGSGAAMWCLNIDEMAQDRPVYTIDMLGEPLNL